MGRLAENVFRELTILQPKEKNSVFLTYLIILLTQKISKDGKTKVMAQMGNSSIPRV